MWGAGALALLVVYARDEDAAIPGSDGAEGGETVGHWDKVAAMGLAASLLALYVFSFFRL